MCNTYDYVLITLTVFHPVLLRPSERASGTRELDCVSMIGPKRLQLGFGGFEFFGNFKRNKESRGLPGQKACD